MLVIPSLITTALILSLSAIHGILDSENSLISPFPLIVSVRLSSVPVSVHVALFPQMPESTTSTACFASLPSSTENSSSAIAPSSVLSIAADVSVSPADSFVSSSVSSCCASLSLARSSCCSSPSPACSSCSCSGSSSAVSVMVSESISVCCSASASASSASSE